MQRSKIVQAAVLALPLAAWSCGPQRADTRESYTEASPGAPPAMTTSGTLSLGSRIGDDGRLASHPGTFKRGEPVIASIEAAVPAGSTLRLTWTGPQGQVVASDEMMVPPDARVITFKAQDTTAWTPGQYRVDTNAGATTMGSKTFTIE